MRKILLLLVLGLSVILVPAVTAFPARAQNNRVALLTIVRLGVKVKRANTDRWVTIRKATLLGAGDSVLTDAYGQAHIVFSPSGSETDVLAASEFRLDSFSGESDITLSTTLLSGYSTQIVARGTAASLKYHYGMPGLELSGESAEFRARIDRGGRSSVILSAGTVTAVNTGAASATSAKTSGDIPAGSGVRAEAGKGLSDIVPATNFANLDSSLDGCGALIDTLGGVILYVRVGPGLSFTRIGLLGNQYRQWIYGSTETTRWFRVKYMGGYGWVYAPALQLEKSCAGLRKYPDSFGPEDTGRYTGLDSGALATLTALPPPTDLPTPTTTP